MVLLSLVLAQDASDPCEGQDARTCKEEAAEEDVGEVLDASDPDGMGGLIGAKGSGGLGSRGGGFGTADGSEGGLGGGFGGGVGHGAGGGSTTFGEPIILGALDLSVMTPVVEGLGPAVEGCRAQHPASGKVVIKFVVAKDGAVSSATVKSSTTGNAALDGCVAEAFKTPVFPEPKGGGIVITSWPVLLQ